MRIDRFLSQAGLASRKEIAKAAKGGHVCVNGVCVKDCSASELQCAAFVICHEQSKGHKPEARDIISIEELERITGFTYFSNVPNAPKSTFNASDWL